MQFQQYKALWIAGILLGVLAVVLGFLSFRSRATFADASTRLRSAQGSIERLQRAQPFPSAENVAIATENLEQLRAFRDSLLETMSRDQFEPLAVEPAAFPLGPALMRLRSAARQHQVSLKENEDFGFGLYVQDGVPASATNEMKRLTIQLQAIEHVCRVLFTSGISELVAVERTLFETPGRGAEEERTSRRRGAQVDFMPAMSVVEAEEEAGLFAPERVKVQFRSEPQVVWRVLNAFAADRAFVVVSDIKIESDAIGVETSTARAPTPAARAPTPAARPAADQPLPGPVPHHERIVAGEERVDVTLTLDLYRFERPARDDGAEPDGGGLPHG